MNYKNFYCSLVLCIFTSWLQAQSPGGVDWLSAPGTQGQVTQTTYTAGGAYSDVLDMIENAPGATALADPGIVLDSTVNINNAAILPNNTGFRFEFYIFTPVAGNYRFRICSDDGSRLAIYNDELINNDASQAITCLNSGNYYLTANTYHPVVVDFHQGGGLAGLHLEWDVPGGAVTYTTIPASQIYSRDPGVGAGLWLKADDIAQGNNTTVFTWVDASPFGNNAASAGWRPDFYTNRVNFNPAVEFEDGSGPEWFEIPSVFGTAHYPDADVFVVFDTDDGDDNPLVHEEHLRRYNPSNQDGDFYIDSDGGEVKWQARQNEKKDNHIGNNQFMLWSGHMHNSTNASRNPHTQKLSLYENGNRVDQGNNDVSFKGNNQIMYIGSDNGPEEHDGDIAEVVIYTKPLTNDERIRVSSYLAIKYGLTLSHNYLSSSGTTIWDRGTTASTSGDTYNNDIAGIGRDNGSDLNQPRSKSESNDAVVDIQGTPGNNNFLVWGCNNRNFNIIDQASSGMNILRRHWHVQRTGNPGAVTVRFDVSGVNVVSPGDLDLVVATDDEFSSGVQRYTGTLAGNTYTFSNITFNDGDYFTLGEGTLSITFSSNDPGAPNTWEACRGSNVSIDYDGLSNHPGSVRIYTGTNPITTTDVIVSPTGMGTSANGLTGTLTFNIPNNAVSGPINLIAGGISLYASTEILLINTDNPSISISKTPVCATDTIQLTGTPAGGSFSSTTHASAIFNSAGTDYLDGNLIHTGISNNGSVATNLRYTYYPLYTNGVSCANPTLFEENVTIYDNRLTSVVFQPEITPNFTIAPNDKLDLDTMYLASSIAPSISPFTLSFSGTFVQNDIAGDYFLHGGSGHGTFIVTSSYDNNGCIGSTTSELDIIPPISIPGLPERLCREAAPVLFYRNQDYRDTTTFDTVFNLNGNVAYVRRTILTLDRVETSDLALNSSITQPVTTINNEQWYLNPDVSVIPAIHPSVTIIFRYEQDITTYLYPTGTTLSNLISGSVSPTGTTNSTSRFKAQQTVGLEDRPTVVLDTMFTPVINWCENAAEFTMVSDPPYESSFTTTHWTQHIGTGSIDTLNQDSLLNFQDLYAIYDPFAAADQEFDMIYTINRYGCIDSDTARFQIIRPEQPFFTGVNFPENVYCAADAIDLWSALPAATSGGIGGIGDGGVFTSPTAQMAIGVTNAGAPTGIANMFAPHQAPSGEHEITYTYTDIYGCVSKFIDTIEVRAEPDFQLQTADGESQYCANVTSVGLEIFSPTGTVWDSVAYFGNGVDNTNAALLGTATFDPNNALGGGSGTVLLEANFVDTFGCVGDDQILVSIRPIPILNVDSLDARYCANGEMQVVGLSPTPNLGNLPNVGSGVLSGSSGIFTQDTFYVFDPVQAPLGTNTLSYFYTNEFGCNNTITVDVDIDTIPHAQLLGLPDSLCESEGIGTSVIQTIGLPDSNSFHILRRFGGLGMNQNTGIFDPALAGTGNRILSFEFIDGNGCRNIGYDTIRIDPIPNVEITGLQGTYCIDHGLDTIGYNSGGVAGTAIFSGPAVTDSMLGIINTLQDTTGPRTLYLSFTDSLTGCEANVDEPYFVNPLPNVSLTGVDSAYCSNGSAVSIVGFPQGNGHFFVPNTGMTVLPSGVTPLGAAAVFDPTIAASTGSNVRLYYTYTDGNGCRNIDTADVLLFQPTVAPTISGLVPEYCATPDTVTVNAAPATGQFVSTLIVPGNDYFIPASGGVGSHRIIYQASDTFAYPAGTLICTNYDTFDLAIRPLPQLAMDIAANSEFCTSDEDTLLTGVLLGGGNMLDTSYFAGSAGEYAVIDTIYDFVTNTISYETVHYFSPDTAGGGTHQITYTGINEFGCVDSTTISVVVYEPPSLSPTVLKPLYCYKDPAVILVAGTGSYTLNGDPLSGTFYDFDVNLPAAPRMDTLIYFNQNGSCIASDTQYVEVAPNPDPIFSVPAFPDREFCIGQDTVDLVAATAGGAYTGDGTRTGETIFLADLAGVGSSEIVYSITDSATGCSDTHIDTFYVYNMPNVEFTSIGGCTADPIVFAPNNSLLGLITTDHDVDSIETIRWNFDGANDSIVAMASSTDLNTLDTITYQYPGPGIYTATLYVENRGNCADSSEVRIVVAPTISVLTSVPYNEAFENSEGLWYAEGDNQTDSSIWAWSETTFKDTIDASTSPSAPGGSKVWLTYPDSAFYPITHNSWVYSPCFDIDSLDRPMVSLDYWAHSVAGSDGAVIEYYDPTATPHQWKPLGEINRGVEWYNTSLLLGEPGSQSIYVNNDGELVTPIGWSGNSQGWKNARYMLDEQKNANRLLQLRVAFGSSQINANKDGGDGFAFDNVWIGPRQRTTLLEHFAHEDYPNPDLSEIGPSMNILNDMVYSTTLGSAFYQDIIHIQYQTNFYGLNNTDQYADANVTDEQSRSRKLYYQIQEAGNPVIDGFTDPNRHIRNFDPVWFEQNILQPEIFELEIDQFDITISGNNLVIDAGATFEPLQNLDLAEYALYYAVVEDELDYTQLPLLGHEMHGVLRTLLPDASGERYNQAWAIGDGPTNSSITGSIDLNEFTNLDINKLKLVVFIQRVDTKEVFQAATNRIVTTFFGTTNVAIEEDVKTEAKVIGDANLYPNPAYNHIFVEFDQPLKDAYDWKLMDIRGVNVREGRTLPGLQQLSIKNIDLPTGTYLFTMQTDQFMVTRKVIIRND